MHFEAVIEGKQSIGPLSAVLVIAEDLQEAEEFARKVYKEKLIEVKELY